MHKGGKILIVDDEPANVRLLERILESAKYTQILSTTDSLRALNLFEQFQPDLVLSDLLMPHLDGFALIEQLRGQSAAGCRVPIVILTADITCEARRRALSLGASDFVTKPFDHAEVLLRVRNLLEIRSLHVQLESHNAALEEKVRSRTGELEAALAQLAAAHQKVVQQECLRAVGVMAGGIAHDFNNSLASILGYSELLLNDSLEAPPSSKRRDYLQIVITAAKDAAQMVARLRDFSRPREDNEPHQPIDLNALIQEAVALTVPKWKTLAFSTGRTVSVQVEEGPIPAILGDAAELREMLTNLVFNAVDAMPNGGGVTIRTFVRNNRVVLEVNDTGLGMPDEVRQRCFEPFFSTKGDMGTGLGLAMVYGIVQRHQGLIEIDSAVGRGTTFSIALPIPARGMEQSEQSAEAADTVNRSLNILVVDDEPLLCQLLAEHLAMDGHRIRTAGNGREALAVFGQGWFDLVITDKAMPEMDGEQLAAAIKKLEPDQRIILLTGFGYSANPAKQAEATIELVLGKPVTRDRLRQAVACAIAPKGD